MKRLCTIVGILTCIVGVVIGFSGFSGPEHLKLTGFLVMFAGGYLLGIGLGMRATP